MTDGLWPGFPMQDRPFKYFANLWRGNVRMVLPLAALLCLGVSLSLYDEISVANLWEAVYAITVSLFQEIQVWMLSCEQYPLHLCLTCYPSGP